MAKATEDAGCRVVYYPIGLDLLPDMQALASLLAAADDAPVLLVLVEYFGLVDLSDTIADLVGRAPRPVIVLDQAPSIVAVTTRTAADYEFTSLRKSLPVPDGADARYGGRSLEPLSDSEADFVCGKVTGGVIKSYPGIEKLPDATYLQFTQAAEAMLDSTSSYSASMSRMSRIALGNIDVARAAAARRQNFTNLATHLAPLGVVPLVELSPGGAPLYLPILHERRDELRAALAAERIFCPVHWPRPAGVEAGGAASRLWNEELSLVIDQRYAAEEMGRIADVIGDFLRG
jgi:hypothetical protein